MYLDDAWCLEDFETSGDEECLRRLFSGFDFSSLDAEEDDDSYPRFFLSCFFNSKALFLGTSINWRAFLCLDFDFKRTGSSR